MLKVSKNQLLYSSIAVVGVALALRLTLPIKPYIELAVFAALSVAIAIIAWYSGRKAFSLANAAQTQAEDKLRQSYQRLEFLANATSQLGTSPDYKTTINNVAKLAVPFLADICIVDLIETLAPSQNRVAVAHVEPAKEQLLTQLSSKYPYILNQNSFISKVVSDRIPYLISEVTESLILEYAQDAEHLRLLSELGNYHSMMIVPLLLRGRILGVISFVTTEASCRIYTYDDLAFAEDLARAIALAIDNAQLYQKTQQAEQRNDEFLALLDACTSSAPIGLAFLDQQGHYIRINDALANIYHINAAENLGKTVWDTLPDELASAVDAKIKQVLQTQQPILNVEEKRKYPEVYCISNYYPVRSELGEILGVGLAVLDISERKQAQAALYQQEQEFKALVENVPDIIVRLDRDLRYLYACPTAQQATGISAAAFIGKTNNELGFPQQMCTLWNQNLQRVFATGIAHKFEFEIPRFDGTHYYESRLIPEFSQDNSINSVLGIVRDMTEYKRAEQALRESEERFRELAENIQDVFWMFNPIKRQFLYVSPAYQQWGYSCDVCADYTQWFEVIHPDDRQRVRKAYLNCQLEEGFNQEYRIIRQDLSISWIRDRCVAIKNESGEIYRLAGIAEDITEQKESQETIAILNRNLQRRAHELQTLFDVIPIAIGISLDSKSHEIKVNPAYAQILNIPENANASITPPENAPLSPYKIYRHGQEVSDNELPLQIASSGIEVRDAEIDIVRADGAVFNLFGYASPLFDEQGKPRGAVSAFIDISDRVSHEAILRNSEEQVRMATTAAELGMWFWHIPTNELTWTPKCNELLGRHANNPMGYDIFLSCLHPEDRDRTQQAINHALKENVEYDTEYRVIWSDNSIHWIAAKGRAFHDASGNPVRMMGTVQDISKRKQADAERIELLEREKAARAVSEAAQSAAEAANRIKDEFLAVLSHELRTPLNPILGWAKLLRKRKFDETATDKALETIERNAKLQAQLIEDLLDVSRILRGKLSLNVCPVNLATTIEAAIETVRLSAQAKSIEIKTILDPNVGRISGDSSRLVQVIWNLLSNAIKFTPPGGCVEVELSVGMGDNETKRQKDKGNNSSFSPSLPIPSPSSAQITVKDTGKGIDPDFLPYVFDYFRQADSSTTRRFGGLGLGLAIVRHIVELHGGTIWAESLGEGQGATFTIQLPLIKSAESKIPSADLKASNSIVSSDSALSGVRVLVVDDDADMREYLACVLQQSGAEVAVVTSAYEALEVLQKSKPDVLLSDIGMPNMDGYMLLRQVRSLEAQNGGQIKAIALTAYAGEYDRQKARSAGFQMHIPKPVEPERLIEALSEWGIGNG
ncbi:PAS/PAC sensor hybrid histidine kinase [Tolypothrix sp. NIES-4075]|uniref:PAS domain S-box protein n=1 Tax=Tolypothrix sp. NIES-4075 TaxID=2005459 RepID=UPI000B5C22FD|nr:PAS domain S-box protein [Tolypothrix sp. NIES-4075]GAX40981.1 PAS/PAC sensor hybrid histidine kinase [Tolypothrix sp. NIES-4075]